MFTVTRPRRSLTPGLGARLVRRLQRHHPGAFIGTVLVLGLAFGSFAQPIAVVRAATPVCVSSGPAGGAYSVNACITGPADGATVSGNQTVSGTITVTGTNPGISRAVFYLRGAYLLTDYSNPYQFTLSTTDFVDGTAVLELEANMKDGFASTHAPIGLTFSNGITTPPVNTNTWDGPHTPSPAPGQPLVVAAVGDGASGEPNETTATGIINTWNPDMLLYLGDVYEKGTLTEFRNWYGDSSSFYGKFKDRTNPVVGNHEYEGNTAPGYFNYWDNIPHYYSYNAGGWHFIALDSTSQFNQTTPGTAQYTWLQNDLAANTAPCTIAYFHHPTFTVGPQGNTTRMNQIWQLFNTYNVDIVLNGHDHDYQRFVPLDGSGNPSPTGATEFVVGTGGHGVQGFATTDTRLAKGLDTTAAIGALKLSLGDGSAAFQFQTASGVQDSGNIVCTAPGNDSTPPTAPGGLAASALGANRVDLNWQPATDNVGVVAYDLSRNNQFLCSVPGSTTSYSDTTVQPATTYTYTIKARDLAGNSSPPGGPASVTTPVGTSGPVYTDDFESGNLATWTSTGMIVQTAEKFGGTWAARATTTTAADWAWHSIPSETDAYYRLRFKIVSLGPNNVYLMKVRTGTGTSIGGLYVDSSNTLNLRNDAGAVTVRSPRSVSLGAWHELQVHWVVGASGQIETWLDGTKVPELSITANFGTTAVGRLQIADNSGSRAYDLAIDDVVVDTQFIAGGNLDTSPPSTPSGLTATATSPTRVDLSWNPSVDNVGVVSYEVFRDGDDLDTVIGSSTTYADSSVDPGASYTYTVTARDAAANNSLPSTGASVSVPPDVPGAPTGLTATGSDSVVSLSWTAPGSNGGAAITGYRIYRGTTAGGESTTAVATVGNVTTFDDTGRANGTTYYYTVAAVNSAGTGATSGEASATPVSALGPPGAPQNLAATPGNQLVTVTWSAPASNGGAAITGYTVYRSLTSGGSYTSMGTTASTSFLDSPLDNGTTYFYKVSATNSQGEGAAAGPVSATPATAPAAVSDLGALAGPGQVSLTWTAPSDGGSPITQYQIWRSTTAGSETLVFTTLNATTSYMDTGRTNGVTYFYKVAAVNAVSAGSLSNEASATPVAGPGAPTGLTATRGDSLVTLAWTAPSDDGGSAITGYKIYRSTSTGTETFLASTPDATTGYTDTGLNNGTTYFYKVSAVSTVSEGSQSAEASATPATIPGAPGSFTATGGAGQVTLTWTAAAPNGSAVTAYKVYRGTSSGGESLLTTLGTVLTYADSAVTPGTTYYYRVSAVNGLGDGPQASEQSAAPTALPPLLTEDFESGSLAGWTATASFTNSPTSPHAGARDGRALCTGSACWAWKPFAGGQTATDLWAQTWVYVQARDTSTTYLLKLRTGSSGSGASVFGLLLNNKGKLSSRNDVISKTTTGSNTAFTTPGWHRITVHLKVATAGRVDVWVDGNPDSTLSKNDNFGTAAIAKLQLGENASNGNFDVRFDDISVSKTALTP